MSRVDRKPLAAASEYWVPGADLSKVRVKNDTIRLGRLRRTLPPDKKWGMLTVDGPNGRHRHAIPIEAPDHKVRGCWCGGYVRGDANGLYFQHERAN